MKKIYITILISFFLVLLTAIYMTYSNCNYNTDLILNFLKVFAALQTVVSFIIAYLLYDRFGTSKKLLEKQNEIIINYIEELKKINFYIYTFQESENTYRLLNISIKKNIGIEKNDPDGSKIVVFESNQYKFIQNLVEFTRHPLFPIDLKNQIKIFEHSISVNPVLKYKKNDLAFVSFDRTDPYPNTEKFMYSELMEISLFEYINLLEKIISDIELWINKESSIKIKLNFD